MIQNLLRGRLLYVVLAGLTVFLYAREIRWGKPPASAPEAHRPVVVRSVPAERIEWWPSAGDRAAIEALLRDQPHVALTLWLLGLFGLGMAIAGLGLLGWGLWTGRIQAVWRLPARRLPAWSLGELGRVTLLAVLMAGLLPFVRISFLSSGLAWAMDPRLWMTVSMLVLDVFLVLTIAAFAEGKGPAAWAVCGLTGPTPWKPVTVGLRAYVAVFPWLFLLLFGMVELSRRLGWEVPLEPIHELIFEERRAWVLALTVLLACVVGPIAEECFFRGVLYPAIRRKTSRLIAMIASGAIFSLVHTNVLGFLPIALLGCLLAYLYERTGSLLSPIAVHILHNTFLMSVALVMRLLP